MWNKILYPKPLVQGATIGVTAPSSGVPSILHPRLNLVLEHLKKRGFSYVEGQCLRNDLKSVSDGSRSRAADFCKLWNDPRIDAIIPPWGGELLINILSDIDFDGLLEVTPKWVLGYSDTSTLLFAITVCTGVATAHGLNLMDSLVEQNDSLSKQTFDILEKSEGSMFEQKSSEKYQTQFVDFAKQVDATFNLTHKTNWKSLRGGEQVEFSGRIIGGCLDTLRNLIGTPYGDIEKFSGKFTDEGILLFLENAESSAMEVCRVLWNMRLAGWFERVNGIVFGRSAAKEAEDIEEFSYKEALADAFSDLKFPVLYDADIGHQPPQMTIINGAMATIKYVNGRATLYQSLK